jgi:hypothetical protein
MYAIEVLTRDGTRRGYLKDCDFEYNGPNYPTGLVHLTQDRSKAMAFGGVGSLFAYITTECQSCPTRPDGLPNRPLRALRLGVVNLDNPET